MKVLVFKIAPRCGAYECSNPPRHVAVSPQPAGIVVGWWCDEHVKLVMGLNTDNEAGEKGPTT